MFSLERNIWPTIANAPWNYSSKRVSGWLLSLFSNHSIFCRPFITSWVALAAEKSKREEHNYLGVESNYRLENYYRLNPTLPADLGALLRGASGYSVVLCQKQQLVRKWQHNSRKKWWISFQMRWTDFREKQKSIMRKTDVFGQRPSESKIDICKFRVGWSTIMQGVPYTQHLYICICICTTLKLYLYICICWSTIMQGVQYTEEHRQNHHHNCFLSHLYTKEK